MYFLLIFGLTNAGNTYLESELAPSSSDSSDDDEKGDNKKMQYQSKITFDLKCVLIEFVMPNLSQNYFCYQKSFNKSLKPGFEYKITF